jgi:hypothetical protein
MAYNLDSSNPAPSVAVAAVGPLVYSFGRVMRSRGCFSNVILPSPESRHDWNIPPAKSLRTSMTRRSTVRIALQLSDKKCVNDEIRSALRSTLESAKSTIARRSAAMASD